MGQLTLKTFEPHPAGFFTAKISRIVEEPEGKFGPQFKVGMETEEGEVCVWCSQTYSAKSKLGKIVNACLGEHPTTLDPEALIGCKLGIVVEHEETSEGVYDRVTAFSPTPKKSKKTDPFA